MTILEPAAAIWSGVRPSVAGLSLGMIVHGRYRGCTRNIWAIVSTSSIPLVTPKVVSYIIMWGIIGLWKEFDFASAFRSSPRQHKLKEVLGYLITESQGHYLTGTVPHTNMAKTALLSRGAHMGSIFAWRRGGSPTDPLPSPSITRKHSNSNSRSKENSNCISSCNNHNTSNCKSARYSSCNQRLLHPTLLEILNASM